MAHTTEAYYVYDKLKYTSTTTDTLYGQIIVSCPHPCDRVVYHVRYTPTQDDDIMSAIYPSIRKARQPLYQTGNYPSTYMSQ
jgi:hypothetical protein